MPDDTKLDILAIAAHPDDTEITCGGLLIKMARKGRKVGAVDLARGEMGTYGDEKDRDSEANRAAELMGLKFRTNLGFPDAAVANTQDNKLKLAQVIRDKQPELVILPHHHQRHPDHLACHHMGYDACFLAGLKKISLSGEPHRPRKIIYASYYKNMDYSFLVDISDVFDQKIRAVAAYKSQFEDSGDIEDIIKSEFRNIKGGQKNVFYPGLTVYELMYTRAKFLGQLVGVKYAEGYSIKEHILIDDPQKMPVRSI